MTKTATPTLADLKPATILALSKMLTKKVIDDARDQVAAGDYEIEAVVHVGGELTVEDDSQTMQVNKLQPMLLLKLAMDKLNKVSVESLVAEAIEIMQKREKSKDDEDEEEADPVMKEFKAATAHAYKKLAKATLQPKRGAVTFDGTVSPVEA
jgi:hypothetical protein